MASYENLSMRELLRKLDAAIENFEAGQTQYVQGKLSYSALNKLGAKVAEIRSEIDRRAESN